jgi:hypothetical protein
MVGSARPVNHLETPSPITKYYKSASTIAKTFPSLPSRDQKRVSFPVGEKKER